MKKISLFLISAFILLSISCDKNGKQKKTEISSEFENISLENKENKFDYEDYEFIDPEDFFNLDYRPENPEEKQKAKKVNLNNQNPSDEKSTSVIPGLRPLNEYKTKYQTKRINLAEYLDYLKSQKKSKETENNSFIIEESSQNSAKNKETSKNSKNSSQEGKAKSLQEEIKETETSPFCVKDWGPKESIPASIEKTQFYVEFNYPITTMKALSDPDELQKTAASIIKITPEVKGHYIFYGTRNISFEASSPLEADTEYTITVSDKLKSPGGQKISGEKIFKTKSEGVQIIKIFPMDGCPKEIKPSYTYSDNAGISKNLAKYSKIRFNGYLTSEKVEKVLKMYIQKNGESDRKELSYTINPSFDKNDSFSEDKIYTNSFYIQITSPLEDNSKIIAEVPSFPSGKNFSTTYYTLKPFKIVESYDSTGYFQSAISWSFTFNQYVDKDSVLDSVKVQDYELSEKNINIYGKTLVICNLKLPPNEERKITVNKNIKSIYGQTLLEGKSESITGRYTSGYAKFLDNGTKMLEAQFPHKLIFEYMNAGKDSAYRVSKSNDPLYIPSWNKYWKSEEGDGVNFGGSTAYNIREFQEIDLEPYLKNGKGTVRFDADIKTLCYEDGEVSYDSRKNFLNLQITDLAATVRFGINKAVVLVRSLSSGKPVKNCKVYFKSTSDDKKGLKSDYALTDENGFAIINGTKKYQALFTRYGDDWSTVLVCETNDDSIEFLPRNYYGVYTDSIYGALQDKAITFMFVDRGLYRPGETVTFRGIDRNQKMGSFVPFKGNYAITLEKNSWRDSKIYGNLYGSTSSSGGFWGTFELPEDLEPGSYTIRYRRKNENYDQPIYFDVAYFEKVKIQGSVTPEETTVYAGDKIDAELEASYLAGGYLACEAYESSWFTQPSEFSPEDKKFENYTFGIHSYYDDDYEGRKFVSSEKGLLSKRGNAKISCSTEGDMKGTPYLYRVEAKVTDESNQQITVSSSKIVHPALFYAGIGKAEGVRGFAKTDKELSFPVILVTPEEKILEEMSLVNSKIDYSFERHYWSYDLQNSINNNVYKRYTEHTDIEESGSVKASASQKIKFTPKKAGYYTLRITALDKDGRKAISTRNFYVTGSKASCYFSDDDTSIKLTPDKSIYNPGDKAQLLMESPLEEGDYLICVEREGIFTEEVRHLKENTCVIEVPVARNYVPVCYVTVSSYSNRKEKPSHEYGEKDMGKPKSYSGIAKIFVNPMVRAFTIESSCDKSVYKPGDTAKITFTATKNGKALPNAELTVMGVDRAVLDIINYHVPDPVSFFYDQYNFPLRVHGGDSRDYLMDPVTYSIKNLQGGDEDNDKDEKERKDFRPTAFFEPNILTDENGQATVQFKVPDSLTTYRLTAFGVKEELLALSEDEFAVQNPINIQAVQAGKLRVRDTSECGVLLTNIDSESHEVEVTLSLRSPKSNTQEDETLGLITKAGKAFIDGEESHKVKVTPGNSSVVYFDLACLEEGEIELVYSIKSDVLTEKLVSPVKIEKTYLMETVALQGKTDYFDGKEVQAAETFAIPSFINDEKGSLSVTLDASRLGSLGSAVNYVFSYPYGCLEQQTAKILPLVIFEKYIDVFQMDSKVKNSRKLVKNYFKSWKKSQLESGLFPYWESSSNANLYVSIRMAHIYADAMENGYTSKDFPIDIKKLEEGISREVLKLVEDDKTGNYSLNLASYALYVLTKLKCSNLNKLLPLLEDKCSESNSIRALTALCYYNLGDSESLEKASYHASKIRQYMRPTLRSVDITEPFATVSFWFHRDIDTISDILKLFVRLNPEDEMIDRLIFNLLSECSNGYWYSTATTANILETFSDLIKYRKIDTTDFDSQVFVNDKIIAEKSFKGSGAKAYTVTKDFSESPLAELNKDEETLLKFKAKGSGTLYYNAELKYALPDEVQNKIDNGFNLNFEITDYDTKEKIPADSSNLIYQLESGKTYTLTASISTTKDAYNTALRIPVPSGCEILNPEFATSGSDALISAPYTSNLLIYDNELQCFWDNFEKGTKKVSFQFRAVRRGVYPTPPVMAECMYSNDYFGHTDGFIFTIK